jgi:hypothetical protein
VFAELARTDPSALVNGAAGFTVIDEVQSAPALFPVLKRKVDRHPVPGRFLLTGSANVFMLPKAAESLAGRMEVLTLEPLSQAEVESSPHNFVDALMLCSAPLPGRGAPCRPTGPDCASVLLPTWRAPFSERHAYREQRHPWPETVPFIWRSFTNCAKIATKLRQV